MEPIDIEKALQGHPVRLRNGEKAYIRYREVELPVTRKLTGYWKSNNSAYVPVGWTEDGKSTSSVHLDIVGMWKSAPLVFLYWGEINRVFNYIAKDKDGEWWAFAEKPIQQDNHYDSTTIAACAPLKALSDKIFPDCEWYESLMERPR